MTLPEKHPLWRLNESDRAAIIAQAHRLARKLELPPEAHDEVLELMRQCSLRLAVQECKEQRETDNG